MENEASGIPGADGWSHLVPILFSPGVQEKEVGGGESLITFRGFSERPEEAEAVN